LTGGGTNPDSPESPQHNIFTDERVNAVGDLIISNLSQKGRKHIIDQINTNIPLHVQEELLDLLVKNKLTTAKTHEIFNGYAPGLLNEMQEQILSLDISHQKKILPIFVKDKNQQAALISVLQEAHKLKKSQSKDFQEYSPSYTVTEIPTLLQDEIKNLKGINATIDAVLPSVKSNIASDASKVVSGLSTASSGLLQAITSTQKLGTSVSPAVRGVLKTASGIKEAGSVVVSRVVSGANEAVRVLGETSVSDIVSKAPKILKEASVSDVVSSATKVISVGYSAVACVGLMSGLSFSERMQNAKRVMEAQRVLKDLDKQLISKEDVKNLRRIISEHLPPKKAKEFVEEINKKMPVEQQEELLALLERGELTRGKVQNTFNRHAAGLLNLMQDEVISLPRKVQEKLLPYLVKTEDQQAALLNVLQQARELRKLPDSTTQMSKSENLTAQQRLEKQKDERQSFYVRAK
jgi:hypothetical protein